MMRLRRIELRSVGKLTPGLRIDGLADGINVIGGDNEEGKSTLLFALRCAFFLNHSSNGALRKQLVPAGTSLTPEIDIDFETGGRSYALAKAFRRDGISLQTPAAALRGADAENELEALLDFGDGGRAKSRFASEHMGLSGLFWIDQGTAFERARPGESDQRRLAGLLAAEMDHVVSGSDGDRLFVEAERQHGEFWSKSGRPLSNGRLSEAEQRYDQLEETCLDLQGRLERLEGKLDRLRRARAERERTLGENRESRDGEKLHAVRERIEKARERRNELALLRQTLRVADNDVRTLEERRQRRAQQRELVQELLDDRERLEGERIDLGRKACAIEEAFAGDEGLYRKLREGLGMKKRRLRAIEANERRQRDMASLDSLRRQRDGIALLNQRLVELDGERRDHRIEDKDVADLRNAESEASTARAALDVVATRLVFEPDADQRIIAGEGEEKPPRQPVELLHPASFMLEGFGRLHVTPGSEGLGERERRWRKLDAILRERLDALGVASVEEAHEQALRRQRIEAEIDRIHTERRARLGDFTVETLEREIAGLQAALDDADPAGIERTSHGEENDPERLRVEIAAGEEELETCEERLRGREQERHSAREALAVCEAKSGDLGTRLERETERLNDELSAMPDADLDTSLGEACERRDGTASEHARLELALRDEDPSLLEEEAAHLERRIEELAGDRRQRERLIEQLATEIRIEGGEGIGERHDNARAERDAAERERDRVRREAEAAKLLYRILDEERRRSRDMLTEPVRTRLERQLPFVIPGAGAFFDADDFSLSEIRRSEQPEAFETLSIGTREQLSIMVRLALAELLLEQDGEAPPVILDDALVYADEERFDRMKTLLARAGRSLQILILTCRPRDYAGLGKSYRLEDCLLG
ncbi:MAG: hypothetical protein KDF64_14765 [Geminicoccaceae bacterium]|nr:hypothetical protein [Geminicoccaceae bacterium]